MRKLSEAQVFVNCEAIFVRSFSYMTLCCCVSFLFFVSLCSYQLLLSQSELCFSVSSIVLHILMLVGCQGLGGFLYNRTRLRFTHCSCVILAFSIICHRFFRFVLLGEWAFLINRSPFSSWWIRMCYIRCVGSDSQPSEDSLTPSLLSSSPPFLSHLVSLLVSCKPRRLSTQIITAVVSLRSWSRRQACAFLPMAPLSCIRLFRPPTRALPRPPSQPPLLPCSWLFLPCDVRNTATHFRRYHSQCDNRVIRLNPHLMTSH